MFVFIGVGEKAGGGADVIVKGWEDQKWMKPAIEEHFEPDRMEIVMRMVKKTGDSNPNGPVNSLNGSIKEVFLIVLKNPGIKIGQVAEKRGKSESTVGKQIAQLLEKEYVEYRGAKKIGGYYVK